MYLYTVLIDPAPATTFAHVDTSTILSRQFASKVIYPQYSTGIRFFLILKVLTFFFVVIFYTHMWCLVFISLHCLNQDAY
jgi:hypothetical protein